MKLQQETENGLKPIHHTVEAGEADYPVSIRLSNGVIATIERQATARDQMAAQKRSGQDTSQLSYWMIVLTTKFDDETWTLEQVLDLPFTDSAALINVALMGKRLS